MSQTSACTALHTVTVVGIWTYCKNNNWHIAGVYDKLSDGFHFLFIPSAMAEDAEKKDRLFPELGGDESQVTELDSLCMYCHEEVNTILVTCPLGSVRQNACTWFVLQWVQTQNHGNKH